ncbi:unnamed protein product [Bursaphelenchus xylophilus]|uniref:Signal recognition particle 9 kDa protein n=1 Tax=Bursaphelenchus xylophilus TaxID=6326 RepID=A0A1I7SQC5_BURXY|nr:unnamed protein product [Bursaphelenchus xylophilus]CAG9109725.1 unnamed protein product [Bursaphelenchus xylophilus]
MTETIKSGVYTDFEAFNADVQKILVASPNKYRLVLKPVHKDGKIRVKLTDNKKCIQYVVSTTADFKKLEQLTSRIMQYNTTKTDQE